MSLDQNLALTGVIVSAVGLVLVVAARLRAHPLPAVLHRVTSAIDGRRKPRAASNSGAVQDAATSPASPEPPPPAAPAAPAAPAGRTTADRSSRSDNTELDDELVTSTVLAGVTLWFAAVVAIGFIETEISVMQVVAEVAIAASILLIGLVAFDITRSRARHVGWYVDLFVVNASIATIPLWFARPWFGQGRFDQLDDWLPVSGSIDVRLDDMLKDYGVGFVAHVIVQAAGMALLVVLALYIVATIVRRARGRYGNRPRDRWISLSVLVVVLIGGVLASGTAVSVPIRTFGHSSFTTAKAGATVGTEAPALALRADKRGRVSVLFARCGEDRLLAVTINGHVIARDVGIGSGGGVTAEPLPSTPRVGPIHIVYSTTRRYETTVDFPRRPRANQFIPLRSKDTVTTFYSVGHGC